MLIDENTFNIDDLFKDSDSDDIDIDTDSTTIEEQENQDKNEMTKAMSNRINEVRHKTEVETQNKIAKDLGYESYDAMIKAQEKKELQDAGYDDAEAEATINKIIEKRLANDPRLKRLEEYENRDKEKFVQGQLNEINKLTGSNFTDISQLPEDTLKMWEKTGNLKQAYLATKGEELLSKSSSYVQKGSTAHMASANNGNISTKTRALTEEEKSIYRGVLGDYITEDELSKITMPNKN